jgi:hypothetical protein
MSLDPLSPVFLLAVLAASKCDSQINLSAEPRTYSVPLVAGDVLCVNSTVIGTHFISGEYRTANFTFSNTTDSSGPAVRSVSSLLSVAVNTTENETVTFTAASFPTVCTASVYCSTLPFDCYNISRSPGVPMINYDDRCALFHGYPDSQILVAYDTEERHDFVIMNNNETAKHSGNGSEAFFGRAVSVRFTSDFATLSNFLVVRTESNAQNLRAGNGSFGAYQPPSAPRTRPSISVEGEPLTKVQIIAICVALVAFVITVLAIGLYCLFRPGRAKLPSTSDGREEITLRQIRGQSLVDTSPGAQVDDLFIR